MVGSEPVLRTALTDINIDSVGSGEAIKSTTTGYAPNVATPYSREPPYFTSSFENDSTEADDTTVLL
jgi:hypothetical protein